VIHESLQRFPSVEQSHALVVEDITVLIPRILVVPGLKCKWSVNEIEIQILKPKSNQARLESRFDALGPVIRIPQLCGNKNVFARYSSTGPSTRESFLQRLAYLALVSVSFRAIEVSKSGFQCVFGCSYRLG
jgi:hypothetical protein